MKPHNNVNNEYICTCMNTIPILKLNNIKFYVMNQFFREPLA